ncbi:hypothetical protein [Wolbachia endosymbiont (group A) of Pogonocherus hispidulus]
MFTINFSGSQCLGTAFVFEAKPAITFNTLLSQTNVRTVVE